MAQASIWVTADEILEKLVHCGVDRALTADMISQCIRTVNRNEAFLKLNPYNGSKYYLPKKYYIEHETVLPDKQRFKDKAGRGSRLNICSTDISNYFLGSEEHRVDLDQVNSELREITEVSITITQSSKMCVEIQTDSVQTCRAAVQTEHQSVWAGCDVDSYYWFILMQCNKMDEF